MRILCQDDPANARCCRLAPGGWNPSRNAGAGVGTLQYPPSPSLTAGRMTATPLDSLEARLRRELTGEVLFDAWSRGRYATDASIYQIEPLGVVIPRTTDEAVLAAEAAVAAGVPILPRGAGTSQCGQTVGAALVIDGSKHLNRLLDVDAGAATAWVEPGIVLDDLNARLKPLGLWYPVDVSTSAQATIGGMTRTIAAARARSATATWCTTCSRSRLGSRAATR